MLNKKEIGAIILVSIILAFAISLIETTTIFFYTLLTVFLVILVNILTKKVISFYLDAEIEVKLWEIKRYGLLGIFSRISPTREFKKPFPAGAFLPIIFTGLSFGVLTWMASLVYEVKPKIYRAARRHGLYSFTEMTEFQIGLIAASGIIANLIFAVIGYLINFPEFSRLNIYYAFYNMLPLSELDGNKIFFGSYYLWIFLSAIVLIGLFFALLVI
jgi:hypothetical protein